MDKALTEESIYDNKIYNIYIYIYYNIFFHINIVIHWLVAFVDILNLPYGIAPVCFKWFHSIR